MKVYAVMEKSECGYGVSAPRSVHATKEGAVKEIAKLNEKIRAYKESGYTLDIGELRNSDGIENEPQEYDVLE
jgi:hypothetical protein